MSCLISSLRGLVENSGKGTGGDIAAQVVKNKIDLSNMLIFSIIQTFDHFSTTFYDV